MFDEILFYICIFLQIFIPSSFVQRCNAKFLPWLVIISLQLNYATAQFMVEVLKSNSHGPLLRCEATGANFGDDVLTFSFGINAIGCAVSTIPEQACTEVHMPPLNITSCNNNFALVPRWNCLFSEKAFRVQTAGYAALIMFNDKGKAPISMSGDKYADNITIPVVMVNYDCMLSLTNDYSAAKGYFVTLKASPGYYDLIKYLVPFVAIVGFCFVVLFVSLVIRLCRERRRLAKKRLPRSHLKKIPTKKYKKGDHEETCAVCLDDFQDGDKLRILPCHHAYHCKCIDPWLTKNRKVCPVCKRKVGPSSNDSSDSDSERASTSAPMVVTRENDPLLRNEQPMATSSSAEFPYPQHAILSISTDERNINYTSFWSSIGLFRLSRLFRSDPITNSNSINGNNNDNTTNSMDQQQQQSNNTFSNRLLQFRNNCMHKWHRILRRSEENNHPHILLDNEDTATTVTHDELEFETAPNTERNEWSTSNTSCAGIVGSFSDGGNSLTTVYSNRDNVAITTTPINVVEPTTRTTIIVTNNSNNGSISSIVGIQQPGNATTTTNTADQLFFE